MRKNEHVEELHLSLAYWLFQVWDSLMSSSFKEDLRRFASKDSAGVFGPHQSKRQSVVPGGDVG